MPIITKTTKTVYEVNGELLDINGIRNYADNSCWAVADTLLREWNGQRVPELNNLDDETEIAFRAMIDNAINKNARTILGHMQNLVDFMDALDEPSD